jgi:hypothetical protein
MGWGVLAPLVSAAPAVVSALAGHSIVSLAVQGGAGGAVAAAVTSAGALLTWAVLPGAVPPARQQQLTLLLGHGDRVLYTQPTEVRSLSLRKVIQVHSLLLIGCRADDTVFFLVMDLRRYVCRLRCLKCTEWLLPPTVRFPSYLALV